tara:strand:+ start:356 stop:595 length:240 start_codon:yes stop_codon:yes gene_type:complete
MWDSTQTACCVTVFCFILSIVFAVIHLVNITNDVRDGHFGEFALFILIITFLALTIKINIQQDSNKIKKHQTNVKILPV